MDVHVLCTFYVRPVCPKYNSQQCKVDRATIFCQIFELHWIHTTYNSPCGSKAIVFTVFCRKGKLLRPALEFYIDQNNSLLTYQEAHVCEI